MQEREVHTLAAVEHHHWWYRTLHHRVSTVLRQEARRRGHPLAVFDAGCGTGGLLQELQDQTFLAGAAGCELDPVALAYCHERGLAVENLSVNGLEHWPFRYDVVLSMDVIYHRGVKPASALRGMAALLKPGGLLVLNVAAMPCLRRPHDDRVMGVRRFRPRPLRRLVEGAGLQIERLHYWNSWLTPLLWVQLQLDRWSPTTRREMAAGDRHTSDVEVPPPALNRMLLLLLLLEEAVSSWLALPWGSSLFLTARRESFQRDPMRTGR